jgi:hypothetical protein
MKKLAIIGAGTSGLQSACHFVYWLPKDWEVTLIHDPDIPSLGIGESTNGGFPQILVNGLNFEMKDMDALDATNKFGTIYKDWRKETFVGPLVVGSHALHFNTHKFKEFVIPRLQELWKEKFKEIKGNVDSIKSTKDYVNLTINKDLHKFDYVINSMGFPKDFSNYEVLKNHMVNHCLVHNIAGDYSTKNYTGHTATIDGWMFEVPLKTRLSHGYLFNDKITKPEQAKENFSKLIGVSVKDLQSIEYEFNSYYSKKPYKNRVLSNGNKAFFFEPMFANSIMTYDRVNRHFYDFLRSSLSEEQLNESCVKEFKRVKDTIYYTYHGGSLHDTPFWDNAKNLSKNFMQDSELFNELLEIAKINNEVGCEAISTGEYFYPWHGWKKLDQKFGYNFFN